MTKFYHRGASGPEELVLVPAGGMSTDAQIEAALCAFFKYPAGTQFAQPGKDNMRAALAAAQAAGAEWRPISDVPKIGQLIIAAWIWPDAHGGISRITWPEKWPDNMQYPTHWIPDPAIRALRPPAAPVWSQTMTSGNSPACTTVLPSASAPAGAPSEEDVARSAEITAQDREYAADLIDDIEEEINDRAAQIEIAAQWLRKNRHEAVLALLQDERKE